MAKIIGLKRRTVSLVSHNKSWAKLFEAEKKRLQKILGKDAHAIEHIGSTSVPGLAAKPVIDISVGLADFKRGRAIIKKMTKAGYAHRPNWGRPDQHILFAKGNDKSRTHYLHFIKFRGVTWKKDLLFRDYLRSHPVVARQYGELKNKLAKLYPNDRGLYTTAKTSFITKVLEQAR
ncbi:MAG TPA: GrpB family protein [Candidatus Paceibacterota bacterium]